jgi:ABC-2 type transport system permease protein
MSTGNSAFQLRRGTGWSRGLDNLLRAELGGWFGTRRWWVQILVWAAIINLILLMVAISEESGDSSEATMLFNIFLGLFAAVGVCIIMQGSVVGEKQSGTAAWVLSKPVSRAAFILAKVVANVVGVAVTIVLAQGLIAYLIITFSSGTALPPLGFLAGLGVHLVNLFFYLALTLMLGAFLNHRGPVIAIPLVFLFGQQWLLGLVPALVNVLPWALTVPPNNSDAPSVAMALMMGGEPLSYLPLAVTLGAGVLFAAASLWAFERIEF